jgi:transcription elongation factor GreB
MQKEYISRQGHARIVAELHRLRSVERPRVVDEVAAAAAQGDRSENAEYIYGKKRLREIDRRVRFLEKRLDVLDPVDVDVPRSSDRCFFGAWVTVEDEDGGLQTLRILGPDETDADRGYISYLSPMGRALLGKSVGDSFLVRSPGGERSYIVADVKYGSCVS